MGCGRSTCATKAKKKTTAKKKTAKKKTKKK